MAHETSDRPDPDLATSELPRVFGYCRVSTDRQIESTSLDEQKRQIRGAAAMIGTDDPIIFSDEGVSGSIPLSARPQGQQLIAGLRAGDTVIAAKLDRMFRDITDAVIQLRTLTDAGVGLVLLDLGTASITSQSSTSEISRLLFHFMAVLADFERNRIRERSMEAKAALRAQGLHPGGAPKFGFRVIKDGRRSRLVPDDREEEIIKTARLAWDQGKTPKQILAELYAAGFRNRKGGLIRSSQLYRWVVWPTDPDRVNISQRTKAALARRKATGAQLGNPEIRKISPLGVAAVMQNAAKRIADVMPHIDELIAAGVSGYREVARILNASDRPSARGGRWHASSVRNAMRAAGRSFPKASRSDHVVPVPQMRIVRPATQRERQAIRERHREAMVALAVTRLGSVQKLAPQILAYKSEGLSAAAIARVLGVTEIPVQRVLRAAGLAEPRQTTQARRREEAREKMLLLKRQGLKAEEIAREVDLPIGQVYAALSRASGIDPRFHLGTAHLTPDEIEQIAALRTLHTPVPEIARRLGRSERTIFRAIAKLEKGKDGQ